MYIFTLLIHFIMVIYCSMQLIIMVHMVLINRIKHNLKYLIFLMMKLILKLNLYLTTYHYNILSSHYILIFNIKLQINYKIFYLIIIFTNILNHSFNIISKLHRLKKQLYLLINLL